ncbi:geranylgeranyl transferase type-2 subunit beta [Nematocida minor]|uniref:geranylgeranyl transferase type-2 subunit beta n=1 Tax=Nematocida minor TaxID=1912983 RepID=UPI00221F6073|nr:geranylgeranyl transferase type-2 subunit beta [Nematocida minor]KAI5190721.1 geranylgeranyl transferase type-2 subunit beta [Nematocida minor]
MDNNKKHKQFITRCLQEETRVFYLSEPIRISTFYWAVASLFLLKEHKAVGHLAEKMEKYVLRCQNSDGGFGARPGYASNPLFTLSALQLLYILKKNKEIIGDDSSEETEKLSKKEIKEKRPGEFTVQERKEELFMDLDRSSSTDSNIADGAIGEDSSARIPNYVLCNAYLESIVTNEKLVGYDSVLDLRYVCCYIASKNLLSLLSLGGPEMFCIVTPMKRLLCNFISQCANLDGGLGAMPGCESHSAYTFCGVSSLFLLGELSVLSIYDTALSIGLLQNKTGGLSGRVDKIEELCSTYWNFSSASLLGKEGYIDSEKVRKYVERCECSTGGYSDRPDGIPDLLHTFYALGCNSILDKNSIMEVLPTLSLCLFE